MQSSGHLIKFGKRFHRHKLFPLHLIDGHIFFEECKQLREGERYSGTEGQRDRGTVDSGTEGERVIIEIEQ